MPAAIARALQLQESTTRPSLETLAAFLKTRALLLILDNCEHVVEEAAIVADALLQRCPGLQILATSREALRVSGEHTYRLPSLSAPSSEAANKLAAEEAAAYAAINLFVERARARSISALH